MSIKMIVSDMDGTLLHDDLTISPYTAEVLKKIQQQGIILTIASGRSHYMMDAYYKQLRMMGYMVGVNGLELYSFKERSFDKLEAISLSSAVKICDTILGIGFIPLLMYDDRTYVAYDKDIEKAEILNNKINKLFKSALPNITLLAKSLVSEAPNKMCLIADTDSVQEVVNYMKKSVPNDIHVMHGGNGWIEFMPKHINKAVRIKEIMKIEGIQPNEVMIFGDSQNDLEMFRITQNSYAMGNAHEDIKMHAQYVTLNNNEDGVAKIVEKILI